MVPGLQIKHQLSDQGDDVIYDILLFRAISDFNVIQNMRSFRKGLKSK